MKLERVEQIPNSEKCKLHFSDGSSLRIPRVTVGDLDIFPGMEFSEEDLEALLSRASYDSTRLRAVRILGASASSEKDLRRKLRQKGESAENTEKAISWLNDLNLINDEETAERLLERALAKGYGKARVRQILFEKGISREIQDRVLEDFPDQSDAISDYIRKHLSGSDPDPAEKKKLTAALLRRGHSWEEIRRAFSQLQMVSEEEF